MESRAAGPARSPSRRRAGGHPHTRAPVGRGAALQPAALGSAAGLGRRHAACTARCRGHPGSAVGRGGGGAAAPRCRHGRVNSQPPPTRRRLGRLRLPFDRWHVPFPPRGSSSSLRRGGSPRPAGTEDGAGSLFVNHPPPGWVVGPTRRRAGGRSRPTSPYFAPLLSLIHI